MFEYHAWITVQSSAGDETDDDLKAAFDAAKQQIEPLRSGTSVVDLRWVNGIAQLHIFGFRNHRGGEGQEVIETFRRVGDVAPGSYGVLYMRDDEDPSGHDNEFQLIIMRRGKISSAVDSFLSPCIPVIEDEDE
jgi:hypothetical protein